MGSRREFPRHRARLLAQGRRHQSVRPAERHARRVARHGGARLRRVVNVASDAGRVGSSGEAVYSACKGGIIALTKTLARELVGKGVILNTICPGPTDTAILRSFLEGPDGARIA